MYPEALVTELLELHLKIDAIHEIHKDGTPIDEQSRKFLDLAHERLDEIREILWRNHINTETAGRGEFHTIELFPKINDAPSSYCTECGAHISMTQQTLHTRWHNKVANL